MSEHLKSRQEMLADLERYFDEWLDAKEMLYEALLQRKKLRHGSLDEDDIRNCKDLLAVISSIRKEMHRIIHAEQKQKP